MGLLRTPHGERGSIWSALQGMLSPFDTTRVCQAADATSDGAPQVVGLVEELRLPAPAWRGGHRGPAWVLIGAGEPQQIRLIYPHGTQPFASWLRHAPEAPRPAGTATLPLQ